MSATVKIVVDGETMELDLSRFMMTEAIALEDQWGLSTDRLMAVLGTEATPPLRVVLALVWMAKVRARAAAEGTSFGAAAKGIPVDSFDVDLYAFEISAPPEPPNPTPGVPRTPTTRTTRTTSVAKRPKRA